MSQKNCARFFVIIASILMLTVAPMSFAADSGGSGAITLDTIIDFMIETVDDLFGGETNDSAEEDEEDEDGSGLPDYGPFVDPNG